MAPSVTFKAQAADIEAGWKCVAATRLVPARGSWRRFGHAVIAGALVAACSSGAIALLHDLFSGTAPPLGVVVGAVTLLSVTGMTWWFDRPSAAVEHAVDAWKEQLNHPVGYGCSGPTEIKATAEGLAYADPWTTAVLSWPSIELIERTETHVVLKTASDRLVSIPLAAFDDDRDAAIFEREIRDRVAAVPENQHAVARWLEDHDAWCQGCGYPLRGLGGTTCSECGRPVTPRDLSPSEAAFRGPKT